MTNSKTINFYSVQDPYGCFSNFSPHPIFITTTWPTSEHYFQAQKFAAGDMWLKIATTKSPMIAARIGRSRKVPIRADWEAIKDEVMRTAVRAKVMQHADVRETLLSTGDAAIVEHTSNDRYWGDGGDGSGKNMLGRILMEVRAELTHDGPYDELAKAMPPPWAQYPDIPRTSIGWRMGRGEDYMCKWDCWYRGLSEAGKATYRAANPAPAGEWNDYWEARGR
jgi:ribA/ribD-fused uncharacterized protein